MVLVTDVTAWRKETNKKLFRESTWFFSPKSKISFFDYFSVFRTHQNIEFKVEIYGSWSPKRLFHNEQVHLKGFIIWRFKTQIYISKI